MARDSSVTWQREDVPPHTVAGGDIAGLFSYFAALRQKTQRRENTLYPLVVIQEAGLDGFWLGRVLSKEAWIENHIVEAASIAMPRRHRRAKTDRIDGMETWRTSCLLDESNFSHPRKTTTVAWDGSEKL